LYRSLLQCNGTKASCFSKDQATAGSINSGRYISPNWAKRLGEQQQGPICPHVDHMATMVSWTETCIKVRSGRSAL